MSGSRWAALLALAGLVAVPRAPAVLGLDHVPIAVEDLERAAERYRALGFSLKPGRPHGVRVLGRHLVLWRDEAGKVHCLEDYCPHRGARLSRGEVLGDNIACRYHGVTLDGSGTIVERWDNVTNEPELEAAVRALTG